MALDEFNRERAAVPDTAPTCCMKLELETIQKAETRDSVYTVEFKIKGDDYPLMFVMANLATKEVYDIKQLTTCAASRMLVLSLYSLVTFLLTIAGTKDMLAATIHVCHQRCVFVRNIRALASEMLKAAGRKGCADAVWRYQHSTTYGGCRGRPPYIDMQK